MLSLAALADQGSRRNIVVTMEAMVGDSIDDHVAQMIDMLSRETVA
jgi:hypothetical protein